MVDIQLCKLHRKAGYFTHRNFILCYGEGEFSTRAFFFCSRGTAPYRGSSFVDGFVDVSGFVDVFSLSLSLFLSVLHLFLVDFVL